MNSLTGTIAQDELDAVAQAVFEKLRPLGLEISVYGPDGSGRSRAGCASPFCRQLEEACVEGRVVVDELVARVVESGQGAWRATPAGCYLLAAPVHRRRRLLGVLVGCCPGRAMGDEEHLARLCDRYGLDRRAMGELLGDLPLRDETGAGDLLSVLSTTIGYEQAQRVAARELSSLSTQLATTYEELSLLYRISDSMRVTQSPREFLQGICDQLVAVVNVACAAAMVFPVEGDEAPGLLVYAGQDAPSQRSLWDLCVHHLAEPMREDPSPIVENDLDDPSTGVHNLVALPLVTGETLRGLLLGCNRQEGDFDSNDIKLMGSINHQAAIFLANSHLYADLQELLMGVLIALSETIDAKDAYTHGHSRRVARISRRIAEGMGFAPEQVERVYLAGLLHDIGKIGVPERVLCKQGRLTDEEYGLMKRHPAIGAKILGGIRQLQAILPGILAHHERPDGRGYPKGLCGEDVPIEGLIVGLADTFDAMTSNRTYRKALPLEVAIEEIRTNAGVQFDPRTVEVFLSFDLEAYLVQLQQPERMTFPAGLMKES